MDVKTRGNKVKTPNGATLGERIMISGSPGLRYKAAKKEDILTPEQIVECITGVPVLKIIYCNEPEFTGAV